MYKYIKQFKLQNFIVFSLITLDGILSVSAALLSMNILNSLIALNLQQFIFYTALDISLWILDSVVQGLRDVRKENVIQSMLIELRKDILSPLAKMEYEEFQRNSKDDYNSWLNNDMQFLYDNGFSQIYWAYEGITALIFSAAAIVYLHWILLAVTVILGIFLFYFPKVFKKSIERETKNLSNASNEALSVSTDYLKGFEVLFQNNQQGYFMQRILDAFRKLKIARVRRVRAQAIMNYVLLGTSMISNIIVLIVSGILIFSHQISAGVIFSIGTLAGYVMNYSKNIANNIITLQATKTLMEKYPRDNFQSQAKEAANFKNEISVKNLVVKYKSDKEIAYPNFEIKKGKKYAILGDSGSGKTTLIGALLGNLTNYEGNILIDGQNYRELDKTSLRDNIGIISQFPYLFHESLKENLTIGREIETQTFERALELVQAKKLVEAAASDKFDENISGGQKNRISIARELMGNKPILIMDESTGSLDSPSAIEIEKAILQDKELTVLMITHHLYDEVVDLLDEVVELKG